MLRMQRERCRRSVTTAMLRTEPKFRPCVESIYGDEKALGRGGDVPQRKTVWVV